MKNELFFITIISVFVGIHFFTNNSELQKELDKCEQQYNAFREGVIYSR